MVETPQLRAIEAFPVRVDGQDLICLRDPQGLADRPIFLNKVLMFLVARMDGTNTLRDIQADFMRATGEILPMEDIVKVVEELDQHRYLDSPHFRSYHQSLVQEFISASSRPAQHAGSAYQAEAEAMEQEFEGFFSHPEGPGRDCVPDPRRPLRGLIAPHIDFHRGGPTYAHAYKALVEHPGANRFVIFGTCHNPMQGRFALTRKHFETPLGPAETDVEFVKRLAARLPHDYFEDEFSHRAEHSVEFQAVFLKYILKRHGGFKIVPILVGTFHDIYGAGKTAGEDSEVQMFINGLRETMDELPAHYCIVAGADLAHVGRRFGDSSGPTEYSLREVEREDRRFLDYVVAGNAEDMFRSIASNNDRRRVCGYPSIYMTLRSLENPRGELLQYRQWADFASGAAVTFASVAFL